MTTRIDTRFAELQKQGRSAFVTFLMAGDPDPATSLAIIKALPAALNIMFVLQSQKPVKGSVYFDKVGFMVR